MPNSMVTTTVGYEGWSLEMEMLITDEWYLWDDFVHFVRYRLGQLSFTYDRRSIRQHLDLPRSLVSGWF